jgi:hypothetical protein
MYLKVITIADITEEMGTHIEALCFEWSKSCPNNTNWNIQGEFPNQVGMHGTDGKHY